ncbi:expressed protein [Dictyostelium purpureum]|uniref:Expressed protein n=1 Tax=Dictyostelium purpureum TaxID=5786 RepID=F0ZZ92_DICPU|nr:uncharacterized protein DICPUDRAFT_99446 [Dictyostelium purpureum]EGC30725.1 expressed protein [Dictyostelium purpureum]|eukprot:XP_003292736.1 expressed protein [Dictyostelium purpureum]
MCKCVKVSVKHNFVYILIFELYYFLNQTLIFTNVGTNNNSNNYYHHNHQQYLYIRDLLYSEQTEILSPLSHDQVECKCTSLYSSNCTCFGELLFPIIVKELSEDHFEHVCDINSKYTICKEHNNNNNNNNNNINNNHTHSYNHPMVDDNENENEANNNNNNNNETCNNAILYICVKCIKPLCLECVDTHEHSFEDIYRVNVHSPNFQILYSCLLNHNVPINCLFDAIKKEYEDCIHLVHFFYKDSKLVDELAFIFNEFVELTRKVISIEKELVVSTFLKSFNKNNFINNSGNNNNSSNNNNNNNNNTHINNNNNNNCIINKKKEN